VLVGLIVCLMASLVGLDSKQLSQLPDRELRREMVERSMLKTYRPRTDEEVEDPKPCMALLLSEQVGLCCGGGGGVIGVDPSSYFLEIRTRRLSW
jgi:hypothetical protein